MHIFFFVSSSKEEKQVRLTICTKNVIEAFILASKCFRSNHYKGYPVKLAV